MSAVVEALSPNRVLRIVASQPGGHKKTAEELRRESELFTKDAERRDRLSVSSMSGNRRKARVLAKARRAEEQRANAKVCGLAANELERRKARTVGEALRNPIMRVLLRAFGGNRD